MRFRNGSWELYAETFGAAGDPALLLLHGAGNSMTAWDAELCERLAAQGRHVIRLDSRDAGKSARADAPGAYSLDDLAADIVACLDALELPAATLAGVSQGGMTAQIVAVEHPERVAGLVLISTTVLGDESLPGPVEGLFSGAPEPPDWYLNLQAEPQVRVQIKGETFSAKARTATPEEKPELWRHMAEVRPDYDAYQQRTEREIPVVVLERA